MVDTEEPLDNKDPMDLDDTIIHKDPGQDRIGSGVLKKNLIARNSRISKNLIKIKGDVWNLHRVKDHC